VGILVTTGPASDRGKADAEGVGVGVGVRLGELVGRAGAVLCGAWVRGVVGLGDGVGAGVEEVVVTVAVSTDVLPDVLPDALLVAVGAPGDEQADRRSADSRSANRTSAEVSRLLAPGLPTRWFDPIPRRCLCTPGRGEGRRSSSLVPHWVPTVPPATASTRT
jgi:hypothetical protein